MAWYDDLISNLANAANPRKNIEFLLGIGEEPTSGMVDPETGKEIPLNLGMVDPGGARAAGRVVGNAGRAVPAARSAARGGRSVPAATRRSGRGGGSQTWRTKGGTPTKPPDKVPTPQPRVRTGGRPTGAPRDVPATRRQGQTARGGVPEGGGAPTGNTPRQYTPRTSSNPNTQMMDDVLSMGRGKKAAAIAALTGGGAMAASGLSSRGGRIEGTGGLYGGDVPAGGGGRGSGMDARSMAADSARYQGQADALGATDAAGNPMMDMVNQSYDDYLAMVDEMSGVYDNLAQTNMEEIAQIFGETAGVAAGGQAPLADTYSQAQGNVGEVYGALDERLGGIAGEMQGIAEGAAGSAAGDVASVAEGAIAPFEAASATASANAQANLAQHSSAGQGYLSNLASASTEEGKMHGSRVQAAANARKAEFDIKRMEIEMAREEALREVAMDTAGSTAEREAMAMLFGAAGVPMPEGFTEMGQGQDYVNLAQDLGIVPTPGSNGSGGIEEAMAQLSGPGQELLSSSVAAAEKSWRPKGGVDPETGQPFTGDRPQDFMFDVLAALDDQIAQTMNNKEEHPFVTPDTTQLEQEAEMIRQIIRDQYGKF